MRLVRRDVLIALLLAAAPLAAYAPALRASRVLAPGDGALLHLPLRVEVWRAYAEGELPTWNPSVFSGTPLLAAYRAGAFHPLMPALASLPPLLAFQLLVLLSLAATGPLTYLYARRLGAEATGALVAALSFALGPYLVDRLGDTPTLVAAPALPLVLLAAEIHHARRRVASAAALAAAVALLAVAGSPEALAAGAILLAARLALAFVLSRGAPGSSNASFLSTVAAAGAGLLLAAPQLVPTLLALRAAAPPASAPAASGALAEILVQSVSHTPAAIFALAALPLLPPRPWLRSAAALTGAALLVLAARGWFEAPGALPLALDLALALLGGLSLSAQWSRRREPRGRRLRLLALVAALAAAAGLSVATTVTGPLDARLAGPLGLLALGLILYFARAASPSPTLAHVFLLPLVGSFLMQPWGRAVWAAAPRLADLEQPTPTRAVVDRVMGARKDERTLVLASSVPAPPAAADLAWAGQATLAGRRNANGYDPLVPRLRGAVFDGMRPDGALPRAFLETDPGRLDLLGIRWLQVPTEALVTPGGSEALGDALDVVVDESRPHLFALSHTRATELTIVSFLSGAAQVEQGAIVAECVARLASGREIWFPIRAGVDTAEWAWERHDVRPTVKHRKATVAASFPVREGFLGHQYRAVFRLPGRFFVTGLRFRGWPGAPPFRLLRAGLKDAATGRTTGVSLAAAYASDEGRLAPAALTPLVSLFEVRRGIGPAWVVETLRRVPSEARMLDMLRSPTRLGIDARREAIATEADAAGVVLPRGSRSSPARLTRVRSPRLVVRADGPGLLVVAEGYDPGWAAEVDGRAARVLRVNGDRMGIVLEDGNHRIVLRHRARGLRAGIVLALATLGVLLVALARERRAG